MGDDQRQRTVLPLDSEARLPWPAIPAGLSPHAEIPERPRRAIPDHRSLLAGVSVGPCDVSAAGRRCPPEDPRCGLPQSPAGILLELVVRAALTAQVARTGQPAVVERDRMVEVAPSGRPA